MSETFKTRWQRLRTGPGGEILESVGILGIAIGIGLGIVAITGGSPIEALQALAYGSFGTPANIASTLVKTVPLILTGLSVAIAFRAGLFNIGGEGQLYAGAVGAAWIGAMDLGLPAILHLLFVLGIAGLFGGIWGGIAGWLRARRGVHEVINTIMLNYIAIYAADYLVRGPLSAGRHTTRSQDIVSTAQFPVLWEVPPIQVSWGIMLAVIICVACAWMLFRTPFGFDFRAVGRNTDAADSVGISSKRITVLAMVLAGAIAGIAGCLEITGVHHTLYAQFSPGYGFDGIAVALLGRSHPLAIIPAALLFGALRTADRWLQLSAGVPKDIVIIMQAIAILAVGLRSARRRRRGTPEGS
jgi:general nucleoside transport system permease protein